MGAVSSLIWTNNARGEMEGEQPGWGSFTGQSQKEYHGYGWASAVHPEDAQPTIDAWDQAVAEKRMFEFEHRVRRNDGEWRLCSIRSVPMLGEAGELREWVGVHTDITERKHTEEALRESEERLRKAISVQNVGVLFFKLDGHMHDANGALERMCGYTAEEMRRITDWAQLTPPEFMDVTRRAAAELAERGVTAPYEKQWIRKDGSRFWGLFSPTRLSGSGSESECVEFSIDITETKRAEEQLRLHRQLLETILNHLPAAVALIRGKDLTFQMVNPGYQAISPGKQMVGKTIPEVWPETMPLIAQRCHRVLETGDPFETVDERYEIRRDSDGPLEMAYFSWSMRKVNLPDEVQPGLLITIWETTARKEIELALCEKSGRYKALFDSIDQGFCIIKVLFKENRPKDYCFLEVNPAFAKHTGMKDAQGKWMRELVPDHDEHWFEIYGKIALAGEPARFEQHGQALGRWFDVCAFRVGEPGENRVAILFTDVTERKRAAEAMQANEERMRLATEATEVGIWEWNVLTGFIRWDAQMFRLYGVAPTADGLVSYGTWSRAVLPEELARQEEVLLDAVAQPGKSTRDFRILRADDGECRHIQAVETVRANEEGKAEWVIGTNLDVTAQKNAERAIREEAQRKDEFLAMLGHELRNPLDAIRHAVQISGETPHDAEACQWAGNVIDRQSQQLSRMVDDLLDVARINRGRIDLRVETLDLGPVLVQAIDVVRPLLAQRRQTLTSDIGSPLRVTGDAARLEQVFVNLLTNAAKYTTENGRISLRAQNEDGGVIVTITDTGVGISAELLPHVFDLFRQADSTLDRALGGLGVGLSVVKSLIEMHLGDVTVESAGANAGTAFTVRLPLIAGLPTPASASILPVPADALPPSTRVLVVDDHEDAAQALARLLKRRGCEVALAHTGPDGVATAREFLPEVLLIDLGLPGFDGYELARLLRADAPISSALFIAISGYAQDGDRQRCLAAGFDAHFGKPLDFPRLMEAIRAVADRGKAVPASRFAEPEAAATCPDAHHLERGQP